MGTISITSMEHILSNGAISVSAAATKKELEINRELEANNLIRIRVSHPRTGILEVAVALLSLSKKTR